jgi:hypothetical protein
MDKKDLVVGVSLKATIGELADFFAGDVVVKAKAKEKRLIKKNKELHKLVQFYREGLHSLELKMALHLSPALISDMVDKIAPATEGKQTLAIALAERGTSQKTTSMVTPLNGNKGKVIAMLTKGVPTGDVAKKLEISKGQAAAVKAHITMGTYSGETKPLNGNKNKVISLLKAGLSTQVVASKMGIPRSQASAIKSHITQGHYAG